MQKYQRLIAAVTMILAAVSGGVVTASPAHAEVSCYWIEKGKSSNCDGLHVSNCSNWREQREAEIGPGIVVQLYYSPSCRSVAASISATTGDLTVENCYVKVERNSDKKALYAGVDLRARWPNWYYGLTSMLYDADVTSYAWGHCELSNGAIYRGAQAPTEPARISGSAVIGC